MPDQSPNLECAYSLTLDGYGVINNDVLDADFTDNGDASYQETSASPSSDAVVNATLVNECLAIRSYFRSLCSNPPTWMQITSLGICSAMVEYITLETGIPIGAVSSLCGAAGIFVQNTCVLGDIDSDEDLCTSLVTATQCGYLLIIATVFRMALLVLGTEAIADPKPLTSSQQVEISNSCKQSQLAGNSSANLKFGVDSMPANCFAGNPGPCLTAWGEFAIPCLFDSSEGCGEAADEMSQACDQAHYRFINSCNGLNYLENGKV